MAISEVCKFEVRKEIDRYVKDDGISRNEASKKLAVWFSDILGKEIKPETIRQKDKRARGIAIGTNVPKKSKPHANKASVKKKPSNFERDIEKKILDTKTLNINLLKVNGFLVDIPSIELRNALIAEIGSLKNTINKLLSEYKENGF